VVQKVLHVIPSISPLRGGPSEVIRTITRGLARRGIDTHVIATDDNGAGRLPVECGVQGIENGVTHWYFPRQTQFYTFSWPLNTWLAARVGDFDIVHIHALFSFAALPAAVWASRGGVPYVVRPLGTLNQWGMTNRRRRLKAVSFRLLERRILRHAARVHYSTEQERLEAASLGVTTPAAVIPNPLRPMESAAAAEPICGRFPQLRGKRLILFLSRIDPIKGVDLLLRAFAQIRTLVPDVCLVMAGDGDRAFVERVKSEAASLGIDSEVIWTGFLDEHDKRAAFEAADLFALPSYSESFGIAVAEAMAAGLPVVISDKVAIHHDVTRAGAGIVVPCEVDRLAVALMGVLTDTSLRSALGRAGRVLACTRYSSDAVTNQLIELYDDVLATGGRTVRALQSPRKDETIPLSRAAVK
jgi:glycosyltransferase involved in cell wall biosynthesis